MSKDADNEAASPKAPVSISFGHCLVFYVNYYSHDLSDCSPYYSISYTFPVATKDNTDVHTTTTTIRPSSLCSVNTSYY